MDHIIAVSDAQFASGFITYWRLGTASCAHEFAIQAWADQELPPQLVPRSPEPETALRRALGELRQPNLLVKPVKGSFVVTDVRAEKDIKSLGDIKFTPRTIVSLSRTGHVVVDPFDREISETVRSAYDSSLGELAPADFTTWLVDLVKWAEGVTMKDNGGVYFIPRGSMVKWKKVEAAMQALGHKVFNVPAMTSDGCVAAVLDAVENEAARECALLEAELFDDPKKGTTAPDHGLRALKSLSRRGEAIGAKVESYEELLGTKLASFGEKLAMIRAGITAAALKAEARRQAEAP